MSYTHKDLTEWQVLKEKIKEVDDEVDWHFDLRVSSQIMKRYEKIWGNKNINITTESPSEVEAELREKRAGLIKRKEILEEKIKVA